MHPEHRSIGELAYRLWQARGCPEGSAERDWLDAEKQLRSAQRSTDARATESRPGHGTESKASDVIDRSQQATIPASDPPANADPRWKAAASRKGPAVARPRQSKSTPGKPSAKPPG